MSFISEALTPHSRLYNADGPHSRLYNADGPLNGEPAVPAAFSWHDELLEIESIGRTWRTTKDDRGDTYLKRHYYEVTLRDSRTAVIYFDRGAKRGAPRWWLYTLQ